MQIELAQITEQIKNHFSFMSPSQLAEELYIALTKEDIQRCMQLIFNGADVNMCTKHDPPLYEAT